MAEVNYSSLSQFTNLCKSNKAEVLRKFFLQIETKKAFLFFVIFNKNLKKHFRKIANNFQHKKCDLERKKFWV